MLIDRNNFELLYNYIYIFTAYFCLLSAISIEVKKDLLVQNKLSRYFIVLPLLALIFVTGFRAYNVGTDTGNYYYFLWLSEPELTLTKEVVFPLITFMLHYFNFSYTYFLMTVASIFYLFIYKALKNYCEIYKANLLITFFACISCFYFSSLSINVIRKGGLESKIRDLIIEYELSEQVHLLGVRDDVPELMAGADLMLMPSLHEGFPVVLVESQAIGLPSLISINISREVDLKVNLIEFENLSNIDNWLNKIKYFKTFLNHHPNNINSLTKQGFDINKNSEKLLDLYISMEYN